MDKGLFITFEGGEGSGKTTQINRLADHLTRHGHKILTTREPGGTPEGEKIRELIVQRDGGSWSPMAETLIVFAAREMHVKHVIKPALEEGKTVICDRFTDSTRAYQGYGRSWSLETIEEINRLVLGGFEPDLTFILDIDPEKGLARAEQRLTTEQFSSRQTEDRFEQLDLSFHQKLQAGFLTIAKAFSHRCHVIDAALSIEAMAQKIAGITEERIGA